MNSKENYLKGFLFCAFALLLSLYSTTVFGVEVTLQWDANTEPNLDHYVIYWGKIPGPPYANNSENLGNFIDKNTTTYTVTALDTEQIYFFAAKAFNTKGLESVYSNKVDTSGGDPSASSASASGGGAGGSGAGGGGCFIATAAYGSSMDQHVRVLREFRDSFLLTNNVGRSFVELYYSCSPSVADFIANHDTPRLVVRWGLLPMVGVSWIALNIGLIPTLAFILLILVFINISAVVLFRRIRMQTHRT